MADRKVLNKYYPPDYDPSKIPRLPKEAKTNRVFTIRTMTPFNMQCDSCHNYIFKAKKFNSRMEVAEGVTYLGLRHYRFFIRCPSCCAQIIYRTDVEHNGYVVEHGARRSFESLVAARRAEEAEAEREEEELRLNPMKKMEKRMGESTRQMDELTLLEKLQERGMLNETRRNDAINDTLDMLERDKELEKAQLKKEARKFVEEAAQHRAQQAASACSSSSSSFEFGSAFSSSSSSNTQKRETMKEKMRRLKIPMFSTTLHLSATSSKSDSIKVQKDRKELKEKEKEYDDKEKKKEQEDDEIEKEDMPCKRQKTEQIEDEEKEDAQIQTQSNTSTNFLGLNYSDSSEEDSETEQAGNTAEKN